MRFARRATLLAAGSLAAAVLAGCGSNDSIGGPGDGRPLVLTSFTVIADMAAAVGSDRIEVRSITKPGAEVHGYEPTPKDLQAAADADLILNNGLGLERWFEQFTRQSGAPSVTLSEGVEPIAIAGDTDAAGKPNPHAWMSPSAAEIYIENIRSAFTELDPAGAAEFTASAARYTEELRAVGAAMKRSLDALPSSHRALVTCEGAFSYLARDMGLTEQYLWPVNAEQEATPKSIAATVGFVRDNQVPAVFCESTVSDKSQRQVARESGARFGGVLYVDSLSAAGGPVPSYLDLLRVDARTIVDGLSAGDAQ